MERILIFIKHNLVFIWKIIEWGNGVLFSVLYRNILENVLERVFREFTLPPYSFRMLQRQDTEALFNLIKSQKASDLEYFNPHGLEFVSISNQFDNRSFLMMGSFDGKKLVGYFFLRFFTNKKCFVGRLIDRDYRGKGIGPEMNKIMYETAWRMGFRCLSTISRKNTAVMRAHANNKTMVILKELQNDYLLVEFVNFSDKVSNI
jgi:RimJ/RimL family protein N-acetyltransferase